MFIRTLLFITLTWVTAEASLTSILEPLTPKSSITQDKHVRSSSHVPTEATRINESSRDSILETPEIAPSSFHWISPEVILSALITEIKDQYQPNGTVRIYSNKTMKPIMVPSAEYQLSFQDLPSDELHSAMNLRYKITHDGKDVGTWPLSLRCQVWEDIYFTNRRLNKGSEIDTSEIITQSVDSLSLSSKPVSAEEDLDRYELNANIAPGKPILWKNIALKPDLRKGKIVEAIASEGSLMVTAKVLALQSGMKNEFIRVKNLTSKKEVQAQILDENHVKVFF